VSPDAEMELIGEYDEIEIPLVKPSRATIWMTSQRQSGWHCAAAGV